MTDKDLKVGLDPPAFSNQGNPGSGRYPTRSVSLSNFIGSPMLPSVRFNQVSEMIMSVVALNTTTLDATAFITDNNSDLAMASSRAATRKRSNLMKFFYR